MVATYATLISAAAAAALNVEFLGDGSVRTSIVAADGSVRPIDLGGTVSGDGSVRTLKGAHGLLDGGLELQSLDVSAKADPFVDFSVTLVNLTDSAHNFGFAFGLPYFGGSYDLLTYKFDIDVKDGRGDGVVVDAVSHDVAVDGVSEILLGPASACAIGAGPPDTLTDCDDGTAQKNVLSDPTGALLVTVFFTLSPYDSVVVKGRAELLNESEIPEPGTLLLLGAVLFGWCVKRRGS
jgi:hypothetical protein